LINVRKCEACGAVLYSSVDLLCERCLHVIDEQTDLLLELEHLEPRDLADLDYDEFDY
jgi:hypothetical protein